MKRIVLIGDPVAHSKSPVFQGAGIQACGLDATYETRRVRNAEDVAALARDCRAGQIHGANITLPHKAVAAAASDSATPEVEVVGVANTWWSDGTTLRCDNTDIYGIQASVAALGISNARNIIVLGAGGAALGVLFALRHAADSVSIVNRTLATAERIAVHGAAFSDAEFVAYEWPTGEWPPCQALTERFRGADLVVQATSLPVHRPSDLEPFSNFPWSALPTSAGLLELCYSAEDTSAMSFARSRQLRTLDGATMLLHQGLRSFERWFDVEAPALVMRDALAMALGRSKDAIPAIPDRGVLDILLQR